MEKLPRSNEEGGSDELVGANAILNRNIQQALSGWQKSLWKLPACQSGKPLTNIYKRVSYKQKNFASYLLNKHTMERLADIKKTEAMNKRFLTGNVTDESLGGGNNAEQLLQRSIQSIKEMEEKFFAASKKGIKVDDNDENVENDSSKNSASVNMNMTFQELIKQIVTESNQNGKVNWFFSIIS